MDCHIFIVIVAAAGGYFAANLLKTYPSPNKSTGDREYLAVVDQKSFDFGEHWETEILQHLMAIKNITSQEVVVERFQTSCGCSTVTPSRLILEPGQQVTITLTLNFRQFDSQRRDNRAVAVSVKPILQMPPREAIQREWTIQGRIKPVFEISEDEVHLGESSADDIGAVTGRLSVRCLLPEATFHVAAMAPVGKLTAETKIGEQGRDTIQLTWSGKLPLGEHRGRLELSAWAGIPPQVVQVIRKIIPDLQVSPPVLLFGVQMQKVVSESVEVYSITGRSLAVLKAESSDPELRIGLPKPPGVSGIVILGVFRKSGYRQAIVRITVKAEDSNRNETVELPVAWYVRDQELEAVK